MRALLGASLVVLAAALAVFSASPQDARAVAVNPGDSVVGLGQFPGQPLLNIEKSGGTQDVVLVRQGIAPPSAYGAPNVSGGSTINGCLPGDGFVDQGDPAQGYLTESRKHAYTFSFAPGVTVTQFSLLLLDWGDFLPFGVSPDTIHSVIMTAYNANGVAATTTKSFISTSSLHQNRPSNLGNLGTVGDACSAALGEPGRMPLEVTGQGITKVTLAFKNRESTDPNIALANLSFNVTPTFVLTTSASPATGGTVTGGGTYSVGTVVSVTQTPNSGYVFLGWTGACSGTGACSVTMTAAKSVTATYARKAVNKDDCKDDGWKTLVRTDATSFKTQGDCIQYVNTGR
jgi:uncharacterized repeat protein (TIGR02543 family)